MLSTHVNCQKVPCAHAERQPPWGWSEPSSLAGPWAERSDAARQHLCAVRSVWLCLPVFISQCLHLSSTGGPGGTHVLVTPWQGHSHAPPWAHVPRPRTFCSCWPPLLSRLQSSWKKASVASGIALLFLACTWGSARCLERPRTPVDIFSRSQNLLLSKSLTLEEGLSCRRKTKATEILALAEVAT